MRKQISVAIPGDFGAPETPQWNAMSPCIGDRDRRHRRVRRFGMGDQEIPQSSEMWRVEALQAASVAGRRLGKDHHVLPCCQTRGKRSIDAQDRATAVAFYEDGPGQARDGAEKR